MRLLTVMLVLTMAASGAMALTQSYGWEDGVGTAHGTYGNVGATTNVNDFAYTGSHSLYTYEDPLGGTPQVYVAWITGLQAGDPIHVEAFAYDDTPDPDYYPRFRLWSHYSTADITEYAGYGGNANSAYTTGIGWEMISLDYVYGNGGPNGTEVGFVIEFRLYSGSDVTPPDDTETWVDDITVTVPDHATIYFPDREPVGNDVSSWGTVKALFR